MKRPIDRLSPEDREAVERFVRAEWYGYVISSPVSSSAEGFLDKYALAVERAGGIPVLGDIHRAVYAAASKPGALDMVDWHTCQTTHCRAGWVVHLAGEQGYGLERAFFGATDEAAGLIYFRSDPTMREVPDWFADNETALEDMRRMAEAS